MSATPAFLDAKIAQAPVKEPIAIPNLNGSSSLSR